MNQAAAAQEARRAGTEGRPAPTVVAYDASKNDTAWTRLLKPPLRR